ncbi:MAG TPA: hypothetical protein VFZ21_12485 [Gemmatimonadaceae bacterium]|jgi:hypothetical protein|nr:hypothetical protein [Gemmatimonadaceae bacterium]
MSELNTERIAHEVGADESLVTEVLTRLQTVRGNMSDDGFATLVRDVVKTKLSFAERDSREDLSVIRSRPRDD